MTAVPTEAEVRARAESDKLIDAGADLPRPVYRRVAALLLKERQAPAPLPAPAGQLLSRFTHETVGGYLTVDVTFYPHDPE